MKTAWFVKQHYSLAEKCGFTALAMAGMLALVSAPLAMFPLGAFIMACLVAPFCPRLPFFLPIISHCPTKAGIALTFDDGPSPYSTPALLRLLEQHRLTATFFVVGRRAKQYPELIETILAKGHSLGNHSYYHNNLLMLRSSQGLAQDIRVTQQVLERYGVRPLLFRPPVGITNSRLGPVLEELGLQIVTFSCRAFDRGNRNIRGLAAKVKKQIRPGDILLLHDSPPGDADTLQYWLQELDQLFCDLKQSLPVEPLEELLEQPVMVQLPQESAEIV